MLYKTIVSTASAIALAMTLGFTGLAHAQTTPKATRDSTPKAQSAYITFDAAKRAALKDAGISVRDAYDVEIELDSHSGTTHYDVEFKSGGVEYSYGIDAVTGKVLHHHNEAIHHHDIEIDD